ncbi:MAG: BatA and WFA domain-containing protein [Endomicrobiales bacterium]|nr:BatA and WFA domain-containing protein [Endomicrobiales bacterium]
MNLSFINTNILWALPVSLLPVILHFFFKKNPKKIEFSDLRFLKLALEKVKNKFRLRQYLLLLTRTSILVLLILFFARPMVQFGSVSQQKGKERALAIVILIDASYSMGYIETGKTRFDRFLAIAEEIVSMLSPKDRIGIISYSDRIETATPGLSNDKAYLVNMLDKLKITNRPTDISVAWPVARKLLNQSPDSNQAIVILSDMMKNGFDNRLSEDASKEVTNVKVLLFQPGDGENIYISEVKSQFDESRKNWLIETTSKISNFSAARNWPLDYIIDNKKMGGDMLSLGSSDRVINRFYYPDKRISLEAEVRLEKDNLYVDNVFYLHAERPKPYKVWIIDGDPKFGGITAESFYLRKALPYAEVITENEVDTPKFSLEKNKPNVVILANLRKNYEKIKGFIDSGAGILVFLGDHYSDEFKSDYLPVTIGSKFEQQKEEERGKAQASQGIMWADETHILKDEIALPEFEWNNILVNEGFVFQPKRNSRVLLSLSSGWPYLVESSYGKGRVIVCASTADHDWNNMVSRPVFAPFIQSLVKYLSGTLLDQSISSLNVGDTFKHKRIPGLMVKSPSGIMYKMDIKGDDMIFTNTEETGIYKVISKGRYIDSFSVNLNEDYKESDLKTAKIGDLKEYFNNSPLIVLNEENWDKNFLALLSGKDVTRYVLIIILFLLLLEVILANPLVKK